MISQKVRNNASISYFFLGWIFLLAKKNPNFSDAFIRKHAKIATQGHIFFFISYFIYSHFFSDLFRYTLPVIQITIDHGIDIAFFAMLILFIMRGVYNGQKSDSLPSNQTDDSSSLFSLQGDVFYFEGASEAERVTLLLSYIPMISMLVSQRFQNGATKAGVRVSSIFGCIYLLFFASRGFDSISMILLFIGILFIIFLATRFFLSNTYTIPHFFTKIPGIDQIYTSLRSIPGYIGDIVDMILGKKDTISFLTHIKNTQKNDENLTNSLGSYFVDTTLSFPSSWIFIPFLNLIFLPKLLVSRTTQYVFAIGQGLTITLFAICIGLYFSFTSPFELFLLFPILYGIAAMRTDVFTKIPLIYEVYILLNTFTFGLLKRGKQIQSIQKQDTNVNFTIK